MRQDYLLSGILQDRPGTQIEDLIAGPKAITSLAPLQMSIYVHPRPSSRFFPSSRRDIIPAPLPALFGQKKL